MNSDEFLKQENTTKTNSNIFKLNRPDKNDPLQRKRHTKGPESSIPILVNNNPNRHSKRGKVKLITSKREQVLQSCIFERSFFNRSTGSRIALYCKTWPYLLKTLAGHHHRHKCFRSNPHSMWRDKVLSEILNGVVLAWSLVYTHFSLFATWPRLWYSRLDPGCVARTALFPG